MANKSIKRWIRRIIPAPMLRPILAWRCNRRAASFPGRGADEIFTTIYRANLWGSSESVSGPGSGLAATAHIRDQLPRILRQYEIRSLLDAPCGDFNWMRSVDLGDVQYIGSDIVQPIIEALAEKYAAPNRRFCRLDITTDPLPAVDLILCRDCFLHLTFKQIRKVLNNFRKSGARYALMSTVQEIPNFDMRPGGTRDVNLLAWPFSLPKPLELIPEQRSSRPDFLGLWSIKDLPAFSDG